MIRNYLLAADKKTSAWPPDSEFKEAWLHHASYYYLKKPLIETVLRALEDLMKSKNREEIAIIQKLTIEHVMPQKWEDHWPIDFNKHKLMDTDETPEDFRWRILHSFGNLTLLTQNLNSAVTNGPYKKKRPAIARQSALQMNAYFQDANKWGEDQIIKRGQAMLKQALKIWPKPD